uniref:Cytochrome b5 heme-binding domain-containing protein n=1 Tax=Rhodosorus marinus TaxID=101924 RepID=A0A7S3A5X9_9RHOD|mmetsp:Transcript_4744/g.20360  ORF Transcript_4744/g.20360 Transcript_4744/m.20360 type:complete len:170 (+) Transcript_4744:110-619(+)
MDDIPSNQVSSERVFENLVENDVLLRALPRMIRYQQRASVRRVLRKIKLRSANTFCTLLLRRVLDGKMKVASARAGKVPLKPGFSQLDWLRKKSKMTPPRPRDIRLEELREHSSVDNAWTAIRGKVYDISHYLDYHPGGHAYLMLAAGKVCILREMIDRLQFVSTYALN